MGCDNSVEDATGRSRGYESTAGGGGQEDITFVSQSGESIGDECSESPFKLAVKTKIKSLLSKNHEQDRDLLDFEHQLDIESCPTKAVSQWIDESLCVTICEVAGRGGPVKTSALSAHKSGEVDVSYLLSSGSTPGKGAVAGSLPESADIDFYSLEGYCGVLARVVRRAQGIKSPTSSGVNPISGFLDRKSRHTQNTIGSTTFSTSNSDSEAAVLDRSRGPKSPQPTSFMVGLGLSSPIPLFSNRGERTGTGSDHEIASNATYNSTHTDLTQVSTASGMGMGTSGAGADGGGAHSRSTSHYLQGIGSGTSNGGGMQGAHREDIVQERLLEHTLRMWNRATELSVVRHYEYHQTIKQHEIGEIDQQEGASPAEKVAEIRLIRAEIASLDLKEDVQVEDALKEYTPEELMWLAHSIKNHDRILPGLPPHRKFFRLLLPQFLFYLGGDPAKRSLFSYDWFLDTIARLQEDQGLTPPNPSTHNNQNSSSMRNNTNDGIPADDSNNNNSNNNSRRSSSLVLNPQNQNSSCHTLNTAASSTTAGGLTSSTAASPHSSNSLVTLSLAAQQQQQPLAQVPQKTANSPIKNEVAPLPAARVADDGSQKVNQQNVSSPPPPLPPLPATSPSVPPPPAPPAVTDAASSHASHHMVADPSKMSTIEIATVHEDAPPGLVNAE